LPGGKTRPYVVPEPDHAYLDSLSDAELTARAMADPDNPPLDDATLERMAMAGRVKAIRARSSASQTVFAARYGIPVGTLRDWEYGRRKPDAAALGFLKVIDAQPKTAARAVASCKTPREAYSYLKNAAELVGVVTLRGLIEDVLTYSAFKPEALLSLAADRKDEDVGVSGKLHLNIKLVIEKSGPKRRRVAGQR
jgi:putative transcriptional regulator